MKWWDWLAKRLEDARIARSLDVNGRPDLRAYRRSADAYARQHECAIALLDGGTLTDADVISRTYADRVNATWGLIARGADAIPFVLAMLKSRIADAREDAAGILGEIGHDDRVVAALLNQLRNETDTQARDSIVESLGALKNRAAIPALAEIIRNPDADGDTQWSAVFALGQIVRKRFDKRDEPIAAARAWLDQHAE